MNDKLNASRVWPPILLSFFTMGAVDLVGTATNYARSDFNLDEVMASFLPVMVFLWFALFSVPAGILMDRMGRLKAVWLATLLNTVALAIPFLYYNLYSLIFSFALLGIGNTVLQVSLNPLVAGIVSGKLLASTLTFGQFVKAISSFLGPIIAGASVTYWGDWKYTLLVYSAVSLLSLTALYTIPPMEETREAERTTFLRTVLKLKDSTILTLFFAILLVVGIDVCMNANTPQLLIHRLGLTTKSAMLGTSLYFAARTIGSFAGAFLLIYVKPGTFLTFNMAVAILGFGLLLLSSQQWILYAAIAVVGFTCANVFSIIFTFALQSKPDSKNEVSSLMIMGIAGGALITPLVGLAAKYMGVPQSFGILLFCAVYILVVAQKFSKRIETNNV